MAWKCVKGGGSDSRPFSRGQASLKCEKKLLKLEANHFFLTVLK